ncbi:MULTISPECIES: universal stress protein [Mycolicibacterium]|jgi:nucleotide-binding universal stress UspA family protein|uniref:Universal stress protein n=1 Tax=Mycolicibacterium austroafricanum TaxID=39687 RepID=A0ABT8H859_MYCAO|nr:MULTISPECIES: universal stress protein [Mycolicibacterium]MDN4516933.1 universal stress protein [Mycolicibacterium austroafricanum]PQP47307.1 universal stress protein [Mycolicibacterium austroafricanum]QRZ08034.1 universal stress protein [Mycolicibacterium austroafricanum]QZT69697.1 universal stress protein [Mycolicibacterium austroafricanum]QZY47494.1 universal stress protein [Mycolicibacterium austroafricanum]
MATAGTSSPVIAGIDGSATALAAALWAVDEAAGRGAPVHLVYTTKPTDRHAAEYAEDVRRGHECLHEARSAVEATGKPVTVETTVVDGPAAQALISLSEQAQMVCVGSVGIGRYARSILGSTAAEVAERAHCPVAVIRPHPHAGEHGFHWIVVAVTEQPQNAEVVEHALREAALRHVPVLALGDGRTEDSADALERRLRSWRERYPDVHIYPIAGSADVTHFLKKHDEPVMLTVIGSDEAGEVAKIIGHGHSLLRRGTSSALVVRS